MQLRNRQPRAFTLVELMISLGIALLLIYGVNLIFRAVTDTIKTGNALAGATRRMRGIDSTLVNDFEGTFRDFNPLNKVVEDNANPDQRFSGILSTTDIPLKVPVVGFEALQARQPAITIFAKRQVAFLNKADEDTDIDKNANTFDENENGSEADPGEDFTNTDTFARINRRVHRLDTISFFAGGTFVPKAGRFGSANTLYSNLEFFPEAWVWYGHALQPGGVVTSPTPLFEMYSQARPAGVPPTGSFPGIFYQPGQPDVVSTAHHGTTRKQS
jgi:hypothetical protein